MAKKRSTSARAPGLEDALARAADAELTGDYRGARQALGEIIDMAPNSDEGTAAKKRFAGLGADPAAIRFGLVVLILYISGWLAALN